MQNKNAADIVSGPLTEIGDAVVTNHSVLYIRQADCAIANDRRVLLQRQKRQQRRTRYGVRGNREVLDRDDFQLLNKIEETDRSDPAQAGVAKAIAVDLDIQKLAAGDDAPAVLASRGSRNLERDGRVAGAGDRDSDAG